MFDPVSRNVLSLTLALTSGCSDLVGRAASRDAGEEVADVGRDDRPSSDAADDVAVTLPQDVEPIPGCALGPSERAGAEVLERGAALVSALTSGFHVKSAVLDARGGVVVFGASSTCGRSPNFDAMAVRVVDGDLDTSFGERGRLCVNTVIDGEDQHDFLLSAAVDGEGRLVFVGVSESVRTLALRGLILRTTPEGALDRAFASQGWRHLYRAASLTQSADVAFWSVLVDGARIVVAGSNATPFRLPSLGVVAAFDASGSLDQTFAEGGVFFDPARYFHGVARRSDGYVVSGTERLVARVSVRALTVDGAPLRAFGDGGVAVHALPQDSYAGGLLVDAEGGVLVVRAVAAAGMPLSNSTAGVVRFLPDGRTDTAFGVGGAFTTTDGWSYSYEHGQHLARQCDGRIVFAAQGDGSSLRAFRFDARGRPDATFGDRGVATLRGSGRAGVIVGAACVAVDPMTAQVVVVGGSNANDAVYVRVAAP